MIQTGCYFLTRFLEFSKIPKSFVVGTKRTTLKHLSNLAPPPTHRFNDQAELARVATVNYKPTTVHRAQPGYGWLLTI
jgi:hypothetical protein